MVADSLGDGEQRVAVRQRDERTLDSSRDRVPVRYSTPLLVGHELLGKLGNALARWADRRASVLEIVQLARGID